MVMSENEQHVNGGLAWETQQCSTGKPGWPGLLWNALHRRLLVEGYAARVFPEKHTPLPSWDLSKGEIPGISLLK